MSKINKQQGFSVLEILISLIVGLVLLTGVLAVFVGMRSTTTETSSYGEMQENGRFAINVLSDDLLRQGFWGDLAAEMDDALLVAPAPVPPVTDCIGAGVNNGSFPLAVGAFRTLWGANLASENAMGCISDAKVGSDIIQIKRVISRPITPPINAAALDANRYYLMASASSGQIFAGDGAIPDIENSQTWEYQHHIYYITEEQQGDINIPVLMQGRLRNNGATMINFQPLIEGVEMIRFWYGIDTDIDADANDYSTGAGDGIVDAFIPARDMTQALWDNDGSRILSVRIYVLVRSILPDSNYVNNNVYQLGGNAAIDRFNANGDNFRRLLFTSTILLQNAKVKVWN